MNKNNFIFTILIFAWISLHGQNFERQLPDTLKYSNKGKKKASKDFKKNQLNFLCLHSSWYGTNVKRCPRYSDEMKELLMTYGINYQVQPIELKIASFYYWKGYKSEMDRLIESEFGNDFISMIKLKSDSLFASKRNHRTYMPWELNIEPRIVEYSNSSPLIYKKRLIKSDSIIVSYLNQKITRRNYSFKNVLSSFNAIIETEFVVDSLGRTSSCKIKNAKYKCDISDYRKQELENAIIKVINGIDFWIPGEVLGFKVNSIRNLDIHLDILE